MKISQIFATLLFVLASANITLANETSMESGQTTLRNEVTHLLNQVDVEKSNLLNEETTIQFFLNKEGQIVVLSSGTDNKYLDQVVKSKLNYKTVKATDVKLNTVYSIHVKFDQKA